MLTQEYVVSRLRYEPDTGLLFWKPIKALTWRDRAWNTLHADKVAGSSDGRYIRIMIDCERYQGHTIVWLLCYGEMPELVDHADRNGLNNRISNLRLASFPENMQNRVITKVGSSGYKNVYRYESGGVQIGWRVIVKANGVKHSLKNFPLDQLEQAAACAREACLRLHGDFASSKI